ncbi:MAG TPA: hypothetical protein VMQ59_11915 [Acidimicrobiales bacterium]|nr:hypothetical protein [Acidimicrobiales bacterium]
MDTGNWTIIESLATAVSAGVLLLGVYLARRYGKRANTHLKARTFGRPEGGIGLEVEVEVKAVGLRAMRFRGDQPATLTVEAVIDDGLHFQYPLEEERPIGALFDQYAGPGETVRCTELFHLTAPADNQVGWWVEFSFEIRRPVVRWEYLTWNETAFVPITVYYELNNGYPDDNETDVPDQGTGGGANAPVVG